MSPPNAIHGFDFAGVVVALGEDLANSERKVGDLVAGMVHGGGYPDKGSFAGTSVRFIKHIDSLTEVSVQNTCEPSLTSFGPFPSL